MVRVMETQQLMRLEELALIHIIGLPEQEVQQPMLLIFVALVGCI